MQSRISRRFRCLLDLYILSCEGKFLKNFHSFLSVWWGVCWGRGGDGPICHRLLSATQNCCRFWKSENFLKLTSKKPSKIKFSNSTISVQLITTSWPGCWWETKGHDRIYKKEKFYAMKVFDSKMNWVVTLTFLKNTIDLKNALHEVYRSYISS